MREVWRTSRTRRGLRVTAWAVAVWISPGTASAQNPKVPGVSVEGDVYLVMRNGDVKKAAANTVRLLYADTVRAIQGRICPPAVFLVDSARRLVLSADSLMRVALGQQGASAGQKMADYTVAQNARTAADNARAKVQRDAVQMLRAVMLGNVLAETRTGMEAHYRFDAVAPGSYALWAETSIGDSFYQWITPVAVTGPGPVRADMDNDTAGLTRLYCGWELPLYMVR